MSQEWKFVQYIRTELEFLYIYHNIKLSTYLCVLNIFLLKYNVKQFARSAECVRAVGCQMTSIFVKMEDNLIFFENGRIP
jgi:hypothetical protein